MIPSTPTSRLVASLLAVLVVLVCGVAFSLAIQNAFLLVALVPILLVLAVHYFVMGGRLRNPNGGSRGIRLLAAVAAGAFVIIGLGAIEGGAPVGGSAIAGIAVLPAAYAVRGVWSARGPVGPGTGDVLLARAMLGIMAVGGVLMVASWIEHAYSIAPAVPLLVLAVLGLTLSTIDVQRRLKLGPGVTH